jgi:hypothetical protein
VAAAYHDAATNADEHGDPSIQRWIAEVTDTVNSNLTVAAGEPPLLRPQFDDGLRA